MMRVQGFKFFAPRVYARPQLEHGKPCLLKVEDVRLHGLSGVAIWVWGVGF